MGLSSNTLLHQTSKSSLEYFLTIRGFPLSYCKEFVRSTHLDPSLAFPMVCFSDIPFSGLSKHLQRYDDYTIGMSKEWAKKKKLNPVLYFEEKSTFTRTLVEKFDFWMQKYSNDSSNDDARKEFYYYLYLLAFAKNYEGELKTKKVDFDNYRFSDEREWRYVPEIAEVGIDKFFKTYKDYDKNKTRYNSDISNVFVPFELTDIKYIVVNDEIEIEHFYNLLLTNYNDEIQRKKLTRIPVNFIVNEQIKTDFL